MRYYTDQECFRLYGLNRVVTDLQDIMGTDKVHLWTRVTPGPHNMYHVDPSVTFMALVSGTHQVNSYAFAAGLRLARINAVSDDLVTLLIAAHPLLETSALQCSDGPTWVCQ